MMTTLRLPAFCLVLAVAASAAAPVRAQTLSPDEKELAAYRLTMPAVKKAAAAMAAIAQAMAQDPKAKELARVEAEIEVLDNKDDLSEAELARLETLRERRDALEQEGDDATDLGTAESISDMEARLKTFPAASRILAAQGLAPREFAKIILALFQASLIQGLSQGKVDFAKLPAGVNPDNIRFVQQNEKELAALQAQMSAAGEKK